MQQNQKILETKKLYRRIVVDCLLVFLVFNFITINRYGITWDEPLQRKIGEVAQNYVLGKGADFSSLNEFALIYYGPFFETTNKFFADSVEKIFHIPPIDAYHILVLLTSAIGIWFLFLLASELFDEKIALYSCLFLMLIPYFVAHSIYNSKETPLFTGFTVVLYLLYTGFVRRRMRNIVWAGVIFGLVLATRLDGILILPIFFLAYAIYLAFEQKIFSNPDKFKLLLKDFRLTSLFLVISLLVMYIAWPELWHNPKLAWDSFKFIAHVTWPFKVDVLYLGKMYEAAALPWHYSPFFLFITTPLVILILFFCGMYSIGQNVRLDKKYFAYSLLFFWLGIRLVLDLLPHAVRYDGIRHYIPEIPVLMIIAALGLDYILKKIRVGKKATYYPVILILVFGWLLVEFFIVFPFGGSYVNELTRLAYGSKLGQNIEIEYWGSPYRQGVEWLNQNADHNAIVCVPVSTVLMDYYTLRDDLSYYCPNNANYVMVLNRVANIKASVDDFYHYTNLDPVFTISRYGVPLLNIYYLHPAGS